MPADEVQYRHGLENARILVDCTGAQEYPVPLRVFLWSLSPGTR